jgi:hypothetical protein
VKKGCFIQTIIVLTILTAAVVYILQNHFDELVLSPGKKVLKGVMLDEFDDKFAFIYSSPEKDSFKVVFNNILTKKIEIDKELSSEEFKDFFESINHVFADSIIDQSELKEINIKAGLLK